MNDGLLMFSSGIIQPIILVIFMAHELRNWHIPKQNLRQRHRFFLSHSVKKTWDRKNKAWSFESQLNPTKTGSATKNQLEFGGPEHAVQILEFCRVIGLFGLHLGVSWIGFP